MGIDLSGKGGYVRWSFRSWSEVLALAEEFNWLPRGTQISVSYLRRLRYRLRNEGKAPEQVERAIRAARKSHHGRYDSNDSQIVTARDAKELAWALNTALSAIEDLYTPSGVRTAVRCDFTPALLKFLRSWCGDDDREYLRAFIAFCNAGRFEIN